MIKPSLCDYSDEYILVTGEIENKAADAKVFFKNCAPFTKCTIDINDERVVEANNLDVIMPMHNLLENSDNYELSSGSLYQFKRDEIPSKNPDISNDNSTSFKYKSELLENQVNNVKIAVPLKYISNFFRSLEMPLINCKISLELTWTKDCLLSNNAGDGGDVSFKIKNTVLYVPIVTLSTKDNVSLTKQLNEGLKKSVYWNEYKSEINAYDSKDTFTKLSLDPSFQGVNRLFVLAFNNTTNNDNTGTANRVKKDSHRKYFLPRVENTDYNVSIDGRNFYDQAIKDQIRKYDEIRKIATGKGDDYTTYIAKKIKGRKRKNIIKLLYWLEIS